MSNILVRLYKLADRLDSIGRYEEANEVNNVIKLAFNTKYVKSVEDIIALADYFDSVGRFEHADAVDATVRSIIEREAKKDDKKKSKKPPKKWWDKMVKEVKKENQDYSEERVFKTIGDIWFNNLSEEKRKEIRGREGKK